MAKELTIVRHGQAQHNPRAEAAREKGCTMKEFIALMREDDAVDARLTDFGKEQATAARLSRDHHQQLRDLHLRQVDWNQPYGTVADHCNQARDHDKADGRHTLLALPHVHPP